MPKTKDAFAFQDFDPQKILQRPLFKSFHFAPDKTDEEILETFDVENCPTAALMEEKLAELESLKARLAKMTRLILRHTRRFEKLSPQAADGFFRALVIAKMIEDPIDKKKNRVWKINQAYLVALGFVGKLQSRINQVLRDCDKIIQTKCREEFAANLKRTRAKRGMTQNELAERLRVPSTTYASYEQARSEPSLLILNRLTKILNFDINKAFAV